MTDHAQPDFARHLLAWRALHGRHDLPWTRDQSAYRVWLSEIMLQQTQVGTVIPYFERFLARFADVHALAAAPLDDVLHLWSGLGYYSRARNLHKTARIVAQDHGGKFPADVAGLSELPGIGRSTAGAIVALAGNRRAAILDGNVKRVLARYHAVPGWPGESAVLKQLWALAEAALPKSDYRDYTQALMDLGATLCTPRQPACARCPVRDTCAASTAGNPEAYPAPRPRRSVPERSTCFLIFENDDGAVLLERRPPQGVWGGLWSFPESTDEAAIAARAAALGLGRYTLVERLRSVNHTFTHFRLRIQPLRLRAEAVPTGIRANDELIWLMPDASARLGLSAPVTRLLKKLRAAGS